MRLPQSTETGQSNGPLIIPMSAVSSKVSRPTTTGRQSGTTPKRKSKRGCRIEQYNYPDIGLGGCEGIDHSAKEFG